MVKGIYGSPRIYQTLKEQGEKVSKKRINSLMRENDLSVRMKPKYKLTTNSKHKGFVAPNLLGQNFKILKPNEVWVSDITFIMTGEGWLYLAIILDLYSRKVVRWSVSDRINKELVIDASLKDYNIRKPSAGLIHHSDREYNTHQKNFKDF
jgi:putative transposase